MQFFRLLITNKIKLLGLIVTLLCILVYSVFFNNDNQPILDSLVTVTSQIVIGSLASITVLEIFNDLRHQIKWSKVRHATFLIIYRQICDLSQNLCYYFQQSLLETEAVYRVFDQPPITPDVSVVNALDKMIETVRGLPHTIGSESRDELLIDYYSDNDAEFERLERKVIPRLIDITKKESIIIPIVNLSDALFQYRLEVSRFRTHNAKLSNPKPAILNMLEAMNETIKMFIREWER